MDASNPQIYWEQRLRENFNLHGVGDISWGKHYNAALYEVRKYAFHKIIRHVPVDFATQKVLDIGSGTGFYIEQWKELGVGELHGADITRVAVENLSRRYPDVTFHHLDVGEKINHIQPYYHIISAFDVLFHITEDKKYEQAIANIHQWLLPGGYFIFSENFVHGKTLSIEHQVSRSHEYITTLLHKYGFRLVASMPMFVLMNTPLDSNSRILRKIHWIISRNVRKSEKRAWLLARLLIPLEKGLISVCHEGPSTEIKIYQKPV